MPDKLGDLLYVTAASEVDLSKQDGSLCQIKSKNHVLEMLDVKNTDKIVHQ